MNSTAKALLTVGWAILIIGIIAGIWAGSTYDSFQIGILTIISSIISGVFFIGMGEIIDLLDSILNKNKLIESKLTEISKIEQ